MPRSKIPIVLAILLFLAVAFVASPVWAQQTNASTAISSARNTLSDCYNAAKEAEAAGANITASVGILNEAGALLSQAELSYAAGDFDSAVTFAVESQNNLNGFIEEANALTTTAFLHQNQDFLINVVGSIIGTFAVVLVGVLVWLIVKRKYETDEADISGPERV